MHNSVYNTFKTFLQSPFMLPLTILNNLTILIHKPLFTSFWEKTILNFKKLNLYYLRTEHLWLDGFLFDFLQKKSTDLWIRKFVIYTGFIFSERLIFDSVIRLYLDNILWPSHYFGFLETSNILEMLLVNIYFYFLLFVILVLLYLCFI